MPKTYIDELRDQLKATPDNDIEWKKFMEERIEAVRTATVDGKKYETPIQIFQERLKLHENGLRPNDPFALSPDNKKRLMLHDLEQQYDPNKKSLIFAISRAGMGSTTQREIVGIVDYDTRIRHANKVVNQFKEVNPEATMEEIRQVRGYYLYSSGIGRRDKIITVETKEAQSAEFQKRLEEQQSKQENKQGSATPDAVDNAALIEALDQFNTERLHFTGSSVPFNPELAAAKSSQHSV